MARLQGLQPVAPVAPGTGGSQNLRPWEQAKSPSSEDTPTEGALENQEASVSEEMTLKVEANQDAPAPPSPNADQPSPTAEQGIKVGAGGPSAPLAVPRRAGPPRRNRPQAQKSTSSTSIPSAAEYPSPSQDARPLVVQQDVPAAREDDSQPEEHEKAPPEQISPLEGETATASASIKHDMFDERKDDAFDRRGKKELPVFGLESGQQSNEESEKAIGAKSENVEPNDQHENNEESDEARRARVMQKMATMGGQRLGQSHPFDILRNERTDVSFRYVPNGSATRRVFK